MTVVTPSASNVRWSEVSPDLTHDWYPDAVADYQDTFVELQAISVSVDLAGWSVRLSADRAQCWQRRQSVHRRSQSAVGITWYGA